MASRSLARRFLITVGAMSVAFTLATSVAAYLAFKGELERRQIAALDNYVAERVAREERKFADLAALHRQAHAAMTARMQRLDQTSADQLLDAFYPLRADGSRRSIPQLFDGWTSPRGDYIHGVGAFLRDGRDIDPVERKAMVAGLHVASRFGEALHGAYDNFYFYTPHTRLVMFAPQREDKLMLYRQTAPATLDVSSEEMVRITLPTENPTRRTRCTSLQRRVGQDEAARTGVACVTPFYFENRFVGAFGSTLELKGYFDRAMGDSLPGALNVIISDRGRLIAYPGFGRNHSVEKIESWERRYKIADVAKAIRASGKQHGVLQAPASPHIVAYGRMNGPDWWFLVATPAADVTDAAARSASWILWLGLVAAALQTAAIVLLARKLIASPLRRLADSAVAEREIRGAGRAVDDLEVRADEIGDLARALRSERERSDEVLASLEERVQDRTVKLEAAVQEKSRFLANMSHELRTPLNGVIAVSEVLGRRQKTKKDRELAQLIVSSGRLLEQVLTDILDVSKIEAGEMRLELSTFDMEELVRQIAELHRAAAESKGLAMEWRVAPGAMGTYLGDPVRLTQILSNLLSNAVKFTSEGRVSLSVEAEGGTARFAVEDTGIGFDADTGARLFRRFEQADASITRRFGGTGLGLSICRSLAELMGGEVAATSVPGRGSRFELALPLERAAASVAPAGSTDETLQTQERGLAGVRVLLAEDHPTNQRVVALILGAAAVELTIVENGLQALDALEAERFGVVLMDMQMPEMDGLTATAKLRARERESGERRTPVIMLTANALDEHAAAGREAGADLHVSKPVRPDVLLAAIARCLDEEEASRVAA
jgi:signal transduction histidine kinase/CheY-like chemotaxis protein